MKKDDIQQLLKKYQEGTIAEDELAMLNRLTHKDEVMEGAFSRAKGIIRRRVMGAVAMAMTGLVVLGAGIWVITSKSSTPSMVAMAQEIPGTDDQTIKVNPKVTKVDADIEKTAVDEEPVAKEMAAPSVEEKRVTPTRSKKPVVVCNTQCDADAVISDIWKFLSV